MGRNRRVLRARAHARAASLAGPQSCYLPVVELRAGQSAVVTGAASGIGRALALEFARSGLDVALADVEEDALRAAVDDVAAIGVRAIGVRTDVTSADDVQRLAQRAFEAFGDVHVVCNNAGVAIGRDPLWEVDLDAWRWIFDVNVWGVIYGVRAFVPHFVARGTGHVVNTASMAGLTVIPFNGPYNVTKHAVVSLSETLQGELASIAPAVGVTVLCPALTTTRIGDAAAPRRRRSTSKRAAGYRVAAPPPRRRSMRATSRVRPSPRSRRTGSTSRWDLESATARPRGSSVCSRTSRTEQACRDAPHRPSGPPP